MDRDAAPLAALGADRRIYPGVHLRSWRKGSLDQPFDHLENVTGTAEAVGCLGLAQTDHPQAVLSQRPDQRGEIPVGTAQHHRPGARPQREFHRIDRDLDVGSVLGSLGTSVACHAGMDDLEPRRAKPPVQPGAISIDPAKLRSRPVTDQGHDPLDHPGWHVLAIDEHTERTVKTVRAHRHARCELQHFLLHARIVATRPCPNCGKRDASPPEPAS